MIVDFLGPISKNLSGGLVSSGGEDDSVSNFASAVETLSVSDSVDKDVVDSNSAFDGQSSNESFVLADDISISINQESSDVSETEVVDQLLSFQSGSENGFSNSGSADDVIKQVVISKGFSSLVGVAASNSSHSGLRLDASNASTNVNILKDDVDVSGSLMSTVVDVGPIIQDTFKASIGSVKSSSHLELAVKSTDSMVGQVLHGAVEYLPGKVFRGPESSFGGFSTNPQLHSPVVSESFEINTKLQGGEAFVSLASMPTHTLERPLVHMYQEVSRLVVSSLDALTAKTNINGFSLMSNGVAEPGSASLPVDVKNAEAAFVNLNTSSALVDAPARLERASIVEPLHSRAVLLESVIPSVFGIEKLSVINKGAPSSAFDVNLSNYLVSDGSLTASPSSVSEPHRFRASQPNSLSDDLQIRIREAFNSGIKELTIKLKPVELGEIQVSVLSGQNGETSIRVLVDKKETLDILMNNQQSLKDELKDSSLVFDFADSKSSSNQSAFIKNNFEEIQAEGLELISLVSKSDYSFDVLI